MTWGGFVSPRGSFGSGDWLGVDGGGESSGGELSGEQQGGGVRCALGGNGTEEMSALCIHVKGVRTGVCSRLLGGEAGQRLAQRGGNARAGRRPMALLHRATTRGEGTAARASTGRG